MIFNNNILSHKFLVLTNCMQYFRTQKIPILHLCQPHKHWFMDLFSCLLLLKVKKIFWKMIQTFWFFIHISSLKFLGSLINYWYFPVPDYSKNYKCILDSGFIKTSDHQFRSLYPGLLQLLFWTLKRVVECYSLHWVLINAFTSSLYPKDVTLARIT